jgi:hypothetical protein
MEHPQVPHEVPEEKKDALTKTFAIAGFAAIIIFILWLAVQLVQFIPGAFSSLASLADSVYNYDPDQALEVTTPNSVVNAQETFVLSWTLLNGSGSYNFSYGCAEGVSLSMKNLDGEVVNLACESVLPLEKNTELEIVASSDKHRFVDVPLTVAFEKDGVETGTKRTIKTVTIVNASIPASGLPTTPVVVPTTPVVTTPTPTVPKPTGTKPVTHTTVPKVEYVVPVSDPNGKIDLQVTFIGAGTINGSTFTRSKTIDADKNGAIQFEVKNIGTKTATDWEYKAILPADITYTSPDQKALKPQERAIITLGFDGLTQDGDEKVSITVTAKDDVNQKNNKVTATVEIVD